MSKRAVAMAVSVVAATCLFGGCIENDQSLTIIGAVAPGDACTWTIDPDLWWARGNLDLQFWDQSAAADQNPNYVMFVQIHNNMPFNGDPENMQLDTMAVRLEKATVTYQWLQGGETLTGELLLMEGLEETIYLAGTVDSANEQGGDAGKMVIGFETIPYQIGGMLTGLEESNTEGLVLGLEVVIHGTTLGGTEVTTNTFTFPVYLCWGCMLADGQNNPYACCDPEDDAYYPFCIPGQDGAILPCECEAVTP